jgi:hypothetical protein
LAMSSWAHVPTPW